MPRSGTSLVEQILASHPDVFGAGELTDLGLVTLLDKTPDGRDTPLIFPEMIPGIDARSFTKMGRQYVARIRKYSTDAIFITDKLPHNFMRIGLIKTILPNAKIIHCTRNPMDNCLSLFKNLFSSGQRFSYDLVELGQYFSMYLDLMNYWNETLPGYIYDLSYENLVESQQQQVSNLLEHCGLPWNDACLNFHKTRRKVSTASNAQVRRPIYKDSVKLWKRYEKQLQPLKEAIYG